MKMLNLIIMMVCLAVGSSAFAQHNRWSNKMTRYGGTLYWQNDMQADSATLTDQDGSKTSLQGTTVGAAIGDELAGWIRFTGFGNYRTLTNNKDTTLFGPDFGVGLDLIFTSPLVNLDFGAIGQGGFLTRQGLDGVDHYSTEGLGGFFGLERFIGPNASATLGAKVTQDSLSSGSAKSAKLVTTSLVLGLDLWMY